MDLRKILTITRKEVYLTFTNRSLLIIMIAAPLAISSIVGLVFGGLDTGSSFSDIPVAIVNLDEGVEQQGQQTHYGDIFVGFLIPDVETDDTTITDGGDCPLVAADNDNESGSGITLEELFNAELIEDADAGRAAVESGDYTALIVIPADFSQRMAANITPFQEDTEVDTTAVEVYANSGQPITSSIVSSVVNGFVDQLLTGNIAIDASITALVETNPVAAIQLNNNEQANAIFSCAFTGALSTLTINQQALEAVDDDPNFNYSQTAAVLIAIGSAQAVLFALFAGQGSVISIVEERRAGTLQRLIATPTTRSTILAGKLTGAFVTIMVQITILLLALILVASIVEGRLALIWGTNLVGLVALLLALAFCVSGLSVLLTGIVRTPEQMNTFGTIFNMGMGILGGAFGFAPPIPFAYISLIYWGVDGFNKLARGSTDITLNMAVLVVQGVVFFVIGLALFNRRVEV